MVEQNDTINVSLKSSSAISPTCNQPKSVEEKNIVRIHISDGYFVGVGMYVQVNTTCDIGIKLQNITVENSHKPLYIKGMKSIEIQDMKFTYNHDGILIYNSKIIASGCCYFINNTGHIGVVHLYKSTVHFRREVKFIGNKAGWAILIITSQSAIKFQQTTELEKNEGSVGGAIALHGNSQLVAGERSNVTFLRNYAQLCGGAILIDGSTMIVESEAKIAFTENEAHNGGALALINSAKIMFKPHSKMVFTRNHAQQYGGALHIEETTPEITFHLKIRCFFEVSNENTNVSLLFKNNTADSAGSILYGGWVDYCTGNGTKDAVFKDMFSFQQTPPHLSTVSSNPTRVCVCINDLPDCSITHYNVTAYPGETFQIPAVAVGQMFGTVPFTVQSRFTSVDSSSPPHMKPLQKTQTVKRTCTNLTYTITSSLKSEDMILTVETLDKLPIQRILKDLDINKTFLLKNLHIHVQLNPCTLGFILNNSTCICHPQLQYYGINCNIDIQKVHRKSPKWINATFTNDSQNGVLVHKHCPFDYCKPYSFDLDLEDPDEQCAFHRSGILCGACQNNLSHVFGTSACRECSSLWALLWVPVIALAGIALVVLLIVLNLTVSVGTINGLIFYANIVRANHATFFPPNTTNSFLSWFIAWINLDLGIEACFYNELDAYAKTWLQFVFPLYIWFLVIMIIGLSRFSTYAARLSGRNAVPVLATLFLLSYAKLLRIIITVFRSTELKYPDNSVRKIWLYDGNVDYLVGKHIPLFIAALLLLLISLPYTAILIFIQHLQQRSNYRSKVLFWVQKLKPLFDAYTGPYKDKHRYWTGLLLLIRIVLFLTFSIYGKTLLAIILTVLILFMHMILAGGVYKKWSVNALEYFFFFNLGILAFATLNTEVSGKYQKRVAYISACIAFALFIIIVTLHILTKFKSTQHCNWIFVRVCKFRSALRRLCCKQGGPHHNTSLSVTHGSVELRESLLEDCSQ